MSDSGDALAWSRTFMDQKIAAAKAEMAAEFQEKMGAKLEEALPDIEGRYGERYGETKAPPVAPVLLTFDIVWFDPDRSPTMFVGITGSGIDNGFLTLHADRITHLINMSGVSHVNIWPEVHDE